MSIRTEFISHPQSGLRVCVVGGRFAFASLNGEILKNVQTHEMDCGLTQAEALGRAGATKQTKVAEDIAELFSD